MRPPVLPWVALSVAGTAACDTDPVDVLDLSGGCRDHAAAVPAAED